MDGAGVINKSASGKMMQDLLHELKQMGGDDSPLPSLTASPPPPDSTPPPPSFNGKHNLMTSRLMEKKPDPTDIEYAIERMFGLLEEDGDKGARRFMPNRGGYLNIVL